MTNEELATLTGYNALCELLEVIDTHHDTFTNVVHFKLTLVDWLFKQKGTQVNKQLNTTQLVEYVKGADLRMKIAGGYTCNTPLDVYRYLVYLTQLLTPQSTLVSGCFVKAFVGDSVNSNINARYYQLSQCDVDRGYWSSGEPGISSQLSDGFQVEHPPFDTLRGKHIKPISFGEYLRMALQPKCNTVVTYIKFRGILQKVEGRLTDNHILYFTDLCGEAYRAKVYVTNKERFVLGWKVCSDELSTKQKRLCYNVSSDAPINLKENMTINDK